MRSELVPQKSEKSQKKNKYKQKNRKYHSVHGLNENSLRKLYANLSTRDEAPKPDSNVTHEGESIVNKVTVDYIGNIELHVNCIHIFAMNFPGTSFFLGTSA